MTKGQMLMELNQDESFRIAEKLSMYKVRNGTRCREFYKEMNQPFLEEIRQITGTENGIAIVHGVVRFIITVPCYDENHPVESFVINFNQFSTKYMNISDITYSGSPEADESVPGSLNPRLVKGLLLPYFIQFRAQAKQFGYLREHKQNNI